MRVEHLGEVVPAPEVQVQVGGANVADGSGTVDFGTTVAGTSTSQTITVGNVGTLDLSLGTITLPVGYSLASGFASTLLAPGQTTTFVVELEAVTEGTHAGAVSFDSNDTDENPFDFNVTGTVNPWSPPAPEIQVQVGGANVTDGSGSVDFADFLTFAGGFGKSQGDDGYNAALDLDDDGNQGTSEHREGTWDGR